MRWQLISSSRCGPHLLPHGAADDPSKADDFHKNYWNQASRAAPWLTKESRQINDLYLDSWGVWTLLGQTGPLDRTLDPDERDLRARRCSGDSSLDGLVLDALACRPATTADSVIHHSDRPPNTPCQHSAVGAGKRSCRRRSQSICLPGPRRRHHQAPQQPAIESAQPQFKQTGFLISGRLSMR